MADLVDLERRLQAMQARINYFETLTKGYAWGTWTPTLTNTTNLTGSTAFECFYIRVGANVSAWGRVNMDPTAGGVARLGVSLPIASNFGATEDCPGVAFCGEVAGQGAMIYADTANDRAVFEWIAADLANRQWYFNFGYQII